MDSTTLILRKTNYGKELNYYHTQRNNRITPYGACNITSVNTVLDYLHIDYTDDEVMEMTRSREIIKYYKISGLFKVFGNWFLKRRKLNLIWMVLEKIANDVLMKEKVKDFRCRFTTFKDVKEICHTVESTGIPVIIGTKFTRSGHVVVCNGFTKDKYDNITHLIIHDPYGNPLLKYRKNKGHKGAFISIPINYVKKKIKLDRGLIFC